MDQLKAQGIFREQLKKYVEFNEAEWIVFAPYLSFVTLKKKKNFIIGPEEKKPEPARRTAVSNNASSQSIKRRQLKKKKSSCKVPKIEHSWHIKLISE